MPRLFQSEWNGVDLEEIARLPGTLEAGVPNDRFYAEFYHRLAARPSGPEASWKRAKLANAAALRDWLGRLAAGQGRDPRTLRILSVGAGLGVVELPLLKDGYRVTLHDVQEESLAQAQRSAADEGLKGIQTIAGPLATIADRFDAAYLGTCEYCIVPAGSYGAFLRDVHDLLLPAGGLVAMDVAPSLRMYARDVLDRAGMHVRGILWGRVRSARQRVRALAEAGFRAEWVEYHGDGFGTPLAAGPRARRLAPPSTATVTVLGRRD